MAESVRGAIQGEKLDDLILVGLTPQIRALLEAGPPVYIRQKIQTLQAKSMSTLRHAERLASEINIRTPVATLASELDKGTE